jgi:hypothetical protein
MLVGFGRDECFLEEKRIKTEKKKRMVCIFQLDLVFMSSHSVSSDTLEFLL